MLERTIDELARDLRQRRELGEPAMVLLLGAGASVESGVGAMTDLFRFVGRDDFASFCAYIVSMTTPERYRLLARFLQSREPAEVTPGYRALAALSAEAYFDTILTTNLDPLLDDALAAARLWRKDYLLIVNGVVRPDRFDLLATASSPRVKVIKLHGDLFQRFMAWTPEEMDAFLTEIAEPIRKALRGRDVLVVGHSLRDERIRELVVGAEGTIWYTNPTGVPAFLQTDDRVRAVVGADASFERLFQRLAEALGAGTMVPAVPRQPEQAADFRTALPPTPVKMEGAQTVDDLLASVVGIATEDGRVTMTGFVLHHPRVVVTDGFDGNVQTLGARPQVQMPDGRRFRARVIRHETSHPFGPLVIDVPDEIRVPGLRLDTRPLTPNLLVRIGVAAGHRLGLSSGVIRDVSARRLSVKSIGQVEHLVEVDALVARGSSGAPVVDSGFGVRGFIVAGAIDRPPSYMYPATRWAGSLEGTQPNERG